MNRSERKGSMNYDFYTAPPDYGSYRQKLWELKQEFPFLQTGTIGRSLLGRNIYALTLGASSPCTLFVGGIQAQDWLTCSLLVRFLEHLCLSYRQQTSIAGSLVNGSLMNRGVTVIPLANPDGAAIAMGGPSTAGNMAPRLEQMLSANPAPWNANARGVDLCRNFDASFLDRKQLETEEGITGPGPRWYGGAFPHSEPESRALISLLRGRRVESLYDFQMDGESIQGENGPYTPAQSRYIAEVLSQVSGYRILREPDASGGLKDYFIERLRRPAFTIRAGCGPSSISALEGLYDQLMELMVVGAVL